MPRSDSNWNAWFAKRDAKNRARRRRQGEKVREPRKTPQIATFSGIVVPRIVGEHDERLNIEKTSHVTRFANRRRRTPTPAERELDRILSDLNGGVLKGRYVREHVISGKWIVDFWFAEIRLAVEVDGSIHDLEYQKRRDRLKDADCARFDITVIRISNSEVFGDRGRLIEKLREGWRLAKRRPNHLIGKRFPIPPSGKR